MAGAEDTCGDEAKGATLLHKWCTHEPSRLFPASFLTGAGNPLRGERKSSTVIKPIDRCLTPVVINVR